MDRVCQPLLYAGPDLLAVLLGIQESFNVIISDEEAQKIRTMGQLYDFVLARVARGQAQVCFTSAAFYRLRRALVEVCHVPRESVRPQARLEDLIPLHDRARFWQELQAHLGKLPCLRRPAWLLRRIEAVSYIPLILAVICTVVLTCALANTPVAGPAMALAVAACLFVGILGMFLVSREVCRRTEHYAVHIPPACPTVRDVVYALVSRYPATPMVSETARASDKEIWGTLCAIVGGEIDRPPDSFTRASTFS